MNDIYNMELNSLKKDSDYGASKIKPTSVITEVFSAMVNGEDLNRFGQKGNKSVSYIKSLAEKATQGDGIAEFELNTLRRFTIEPKLMDEIKLLGLYGTYTPLGYGETIEVEAYDHIGEKSRMQAANGDVVFPTVARQKYQVPTQTISGGYAVDYRRILAGDMSKENEGMEQVRIDIRNKAALYVITTIYNAIKNAVGVKYFSEEAGITKTGLDAVLNKVRRWGKPNILGDYSVVSQINNFVPYTNNGTTPVTGISDAALEVLRKTGLIDIYNGSAVVEIPNQYDVTRLTADGSNYKTLIPEGLLYVIPQGSKSPVKTWTRGGLTSFRGNDPTTGMVLTRYDLEVAADVGKGQEHKIAIISDSNFEFPEI